MISVLWFLVPLLLLHCMPAGRHSNSTPDSRRVCLYSRLPCGSYGAGSLTSVVCSRELVSCGNVGTLCCSGVDTRGHVSSVYTLDLFTCAPFSVSCVFRREISCVFSQESVVFPGQFFFSFGFSDLPRAPGLFCDHGLRMFDKS